MTVFRLDRVHWQRNTTEYRRRRIVAGVDAITVRAQRMMQKLFACVDVVRSEFSRAVKMKNISTVNREQ